MLCIVLFIFIFVQSDSYIITNENISNEIITNDNITNDNITNENISNVNITNESITNKNISNQNVKEENITNEDVTTNVTDLNSVAIDTAPLYWDWRDKNMVSPVKNQASCAACWAFSAVANIESQLKIQYDKEEVLSEQFLIDCDDDNIGCGSTSVLKAFAKIVANIGGVLRSKDYYNYANRQMECRWDKHVKPVPVIGFRRVQADEDEMVKFLFNYGPLSAGINSASMVKYKGGIDEPTPAQCSPDEKDMNHAILIVGYNTYVDPKTGHFLDYWIIKNSWGEIWGDNGFYYLVRGRNACGIANDVSVSFVK